MNDRLKQEFLQTKIRKALGKSNYLIDNDDKINQMILSDIISNLSGALKICESFTNGE